MNNISYRNNAGVIYHDSMTFSVTTEQEYELPYKPIYIELYKRYYSAYDYWYQFIPACNIGIRHNRWISATGETSTSYRIMETINVSDFVELTEKGIIFHSKDTNYQNLDGIKCTIYY